MGASRILIKRDGVILEAERARRYEAHLSVLFINVDGLGLVNQKYGQEAGDHVIHEIAGVIRRAIRRIDILGRWAQEDFILVTVDRNPFGSVAMAEKLRQVIAAHRFDWKGRSFQVTCSIGVARGAPDGDAAITSLIETAHSALVKAKARGRNRVEYSGEGAGLSATPGKA